MNTRKRCIQGLWAAMTACAIVAITGCSGSSAPAALKPTTIVLTASAPSTTLNGSVTLTATLAGSSPIGVVTFYDGTTSLQPVDVTGKS
jgi:multidrug efflux pump subunit AcrA (membrane-fusion protein)